MTNHAPPGDRLEPRWRAFDSLPDPVLILDPEGVILGFNERAASFYGLPDDVAGRGSIHMFDAELPDTGVESWANRLNHQSWWEGRARRMIGNSMRVLWIKWHIERDASGAVAWIVETSRDADHFLLTYVDEGFHKQRYESLFNTIAIGFLEIDFRAVGQELRRMRDDGVTDIRAHLAARPEKARELTEIAQVIDANVSAIRMFDGDRLADLLGSCTKFWPDESLAGYVEGLAVTMERRSHYIREVRLSGVTGRPMEALLTNAWSPESARRGYMLMGIIDLTERNRAQQELDRVRAELAHAARVAMIGELSATIAHEVSQPLTAIQAVSAAARRRLDTGTLGNDDARELFDRTLRAAQRANEVVARLRGMASPVRAEREWVQLDQLAADAIRFMGYELKLHAAKIRLAVEDAPPIHADAIQIQQVIINLVMNAIQACAERRIVPDITVAITGHATHASLFVIDNGPGIDPALLPRMFDSFASSKAKGMGIGLSISRGIVESHGGQMHAENLAGDAGARVGFEIPVVPVD